ncbi:MAG: hypothetical protein COC23_03580 [Hyphomicrobiales bacterium]|nr:MAG: hypothetical protein COC23_03580 [Hyphomicrobiales bacterium]PCI29467.1 MAG: hypothetical protein COB55_02025 [Candidatus Wolfebacteria bacterium]
MRVTSQFWVSALCRRVSGQGAFAAVVRSGSSEAGTIFVITTKLDGFSSLWGPAPQSFYDDEQRGTRQFEVLLLDVEDGEISSRIESEARFDSDIWVVEIEDKMGRDFLSL